MAALKWNEDNTAGRLTLYAPILPRMGRIAIGLIWLAAAILFLVPMVLNDDQGDAGMIVLFALLASLPTLTTMFSALTDTTIVIDRGSRVIAITRRLLALPYSAQSISFSDTSNLEYQHVRTNSRSLWALAIVRRDNKRAMLNWNGTQSEISALAEKISALVGVPIQEGRIQMPVMLQTVLEKTIPNAKELIEQAQTNEPTPIDSAPATTDTLSMPQATTVDTLPIDPTPSDVTPSSTDTSPVTDLNSLPIQTLEQRIVADKMDSDARYVLARKYHARGQVDKAIGLYQDTMRLDPTNANAQNDLGVALQTRGKRTEAEAAFRRAIALDPFFMIAHLNLGLLLRSMNRATEASQEFFQARQNARGDAETRMAEAASTGARIEPQLSKMK